MQPVPPHIRGPWRLTVALLVAMSGSAVAAPGPGERCYEQGLEAYRSAQLAAAHRHFECAVKRLPRGVTQRAWAQYNLARVAEKLQRPCEAIGHFRGYLRATENINNNNSNEEQQRRQKARAALLSDDCWCRFKRAVERADPAKPCASQARWLGYFDQNCQGHPNEAPRVRDAAAALDQATLYCDGHSPERFPDPCERAAKLRSYLEIAGAQPEPWLAGARARLSDDAPACQCQTAEAVVEPCQRAIDLRNCLSAAPTDGGDPPAWLDAAQAAHVEAVAACEPPGPAWRQISAWGAIGAGVVGLAVGARFHLEAQDTHSRGAQLEVGQTERWRSLQEDLESQRTMEYAGYGVGLTLLATGVTLLLWPDE